MMPPVLTATPEAGAGHLAGPRPAPELRGQLDHLGQPGRPEGMPAADQAATRVDHEPGGVHAGGAGLGGRAGLAGREEAQRLEGVELLGGRGVVQLHQVGVVGPEPEGLPGRTRRPGSAGRGSRAVRFPSGPPNR